jgi:D-alanyl-D-alanine carboxypeptidase
VTVANALRVAAALFAAAFMLVGCGGDEFDSELAESLQHELDSERDRWGIPGAQAAVVLPGEGTWTGVSGRADVEAKTAVGDDTAFAIGSITKTFVATLVLKLAEDGVLRLDDPLSKWLPGYPRSRGITLRRLLNHTSGVHNFVDNPRFRAAQLGDLAKEWTPAETLRFVGTPYSKPGESWHYSNTGYILLGQVIERATRSTVGDELRERVLEPLGLEDEVVLQGEDQLPQPAARGYGDFDEDGDLDATKRGARMIPAVSMATAAWTAGAMASNAEAIARFADALFGGRVLKKTSLAQMVDFGGSGALDYGLGVGSFRLQRRQLWGHGGAIPGYRSELWYLPRERATIVVLWNGDRIADPFISQAILEKVVAHLDPE